MCALVTGVQTCALPISGDARCIRCVTASHSVGSASARVAVRSGNCQLSGMARETVRAPCRVSVCQDVKISEGDVSLTDERTRNRVKEIQSICVRPQNIEITCRQNMHTTPLTHTS